MYALASLQDVCGGKKVLWFTDNFAASRVVANGSGKERLQDMAEKIFNICKSKGIELQVQWVPRERIFYADHLSKLVDHDDWCTSMPLFKALQSLWGPYTIDRFADSSNSKLRRFNSKYLCPNTERVDAFTVSWKHENNFLVPPISLIPKVISHMRDCKAEGTLVVPYWQSSAFYPLLVEGENLFRSFVQDWRIYDNSMGGLLAQGQNKSVFIGSDQFKSDILAIYMQF